MGNSKRFTGKEMKDMDEQVFARLDTRYKRNTRKTWLRPVKDWHAFCNRINKAPIRMPNSKGHGPTPKEHLDTEQDLMRFTVWLSKRTLKMKNGKKRKHGGLKGSSIITYLACVKSWHIHQCGFALGHEMDMRRLKNMMVSFGTKTEIERRNLREKGRVGLSAKDIQDMTKGKAQNKDDVNVKTAIQVCFQTLLRGGEVTAESGIKFDRKVHLTRDDVRFIPSMEKCKKVYVRMPLMKVQNRWTKNSEFFSLPLDKHAKVSAAAALIRLFKIDKVPKSEYKTTPLFRDPRTNKPMKSWYLRKQIKKLYKEKCGGDPKRVGTHSMRIGGCSTLFAMGTPPVFVQALGRWSSDVFKLYMRTSKGEMEKYIKAMGRKTFVGIEKTKFENHAGLGDDEE